MNFAILSQREIEKRSTFGERILPKVRKRRKNLFPIFIFKNLVPV
ncbi:hypothetical protein LEP1GSC052_2709 [Leptospira kmetyi serovar Malaysia str. Bejo-Iso9]|nr:hypothetical protein LEP1GSC052_2709 [Leptospira kmetyi serovar Malaysia str. Bejo-Iso9]